MNTDIKRKAVANHLRNIADRVEAGAINAVSVVWGGEDNVETQVVASEGPEVIFDVEAEEVELLPEIMAMLISRMN